MRARRKINSETSLISAAVINDDAEPFQSSCKSGRISGVFRFVDFRHYKYKINIRRAVFKLFRLC